MTNNLKELHKDKYSMIWNAVNRGAVLSDDECENITLAVLSVMSEFVTRKEMKKSFEKINELFEERRAKLNNECLEKMLYGISKAVEEEREACAALCDVYYKDPDGRPIKVTQSYLSDAIRARSNSEGKN